MRYNAETLPTVHPMMVRSFVPLGTLDAFGGIMVLDEYEVADLAIAEARLPFPMDEDVVDCSNRIFEITTAMMCLKNCKSLTAFPGRRWRNLREGQDVIAYPSEEEPLLYIGNPIRLLVSGGVFGDSIQVVRTPEFLIRSGVSLGY